jgi:predicted ATPase
VTWYQDAALIMAGALVFAWGGKILDALAKLNKQIENVRYYLGELDERQQRIADKLHAIEAHTNRAVKDAYADDDWHDLQPPL